MRQACAPRRHHFFVVALCAVTCTLLTEPLAAEPPTDSSHPAEPGIAAKLAKPGDLTLRDTPLSEALFTISEIWQINLVVNSEVQGRVNGSFKATPLQEILDSILLAHGYSYRPVGQSLVVTKLEELGDFNPLLETATIPVRFASPTDIAKAVELLRSPRGKVEPIPSVHALIVIDFPDRVAKIRELVEKIEESHTVQRRGGEAADADGMQVMHYMTRYLSAESLVEAVRAVLNKDGNDAGAASGKAAHVKSGNQCVFSGTAEQLALVRKLIEQADVPQPQVRITALIYDISLEDLEELGINWNQSSKFRHDRAGNPQSSVLLDSVTRVPFGPNQPLDGALSFLSVSRHFDLSAVVSALRRARHSRLLADPSVTVLNSQRALLQIIQEVPYQELTQTTGGGNIGTTNFKEVGVKLQVTPHVADADTIQLDVNPSFSRLVGFTPNTDFPIIDKREANTYVRVANGQTLIIGGLRQRTDTRSLQGTPYLKDIKGLGALFRSRDVEARESELVVFLTPEVVTPVEPARPREQIALDTGRSLLDAIPTSEYLLPGCAHDSLQRCPCCVIETSAEVVPAEARFMKAPPTVVRSKQAPPVATGHTKARAPEVQQVEARKTQLRSAPVRRAEAQSKQVRPAPTPPEKPSPTTDTAAPVPAPESSAQRQPPPAPTPPRAQRAEGWRPARTP